MTSPEKIKKDILLAALPDIPFDGWTMECLQSAALQAGYKREMVRAVFPRGVKDALRVFSDWADDEMLALLKKDKSEPLRVRDKIALAVRTRLDVLEPYREAERLALSYWMRPLRKFEGLRLLWKTADVIWVWAGDTSTDYNRYTKRTLLSGVIAATTLFWLGDKSKGFADSAEFLDRRINDALNIGKIAGRFKTA